MHLVPALMTLTILLHSSGGVGENKQENKQKIVKITMNKISCSNFFFFLEMCAQGVGGCTKGLGWKCYKIWL